MKKSEKVIVVATAGWVVMGEKESCDTRMLRLKNASVIRSWGTTNGLGEIAINGPTKNTVLDPCGVVSLPLTSVVMIMDCK